MITYINSIIENLNKYVKINKSIIKKIAIVDRKLETVRRYEHIYDLGLSHTNLLFKKTMMNNLLKHRIENLKICLTKFFTDNYGVYKEISTLQKKLRSVLKEKDEYLPQIPKITLSEKDNKLDITAFKEWLYQIQTTLQHTKQKINLLNEKRDAFETMIRNELPSIDLRRTMDLQKDDLLNEYERIKHRFVSIIKFSYYVTKNVLKYKGYNWDIEQEEKKAQLFSPRESPVGSPSPIRSRAAKKQHKSVVRRGQSNLRQPEPALNTLASIFEQSASITNEDISNSGSVINYEQNEVIDAGEDGENNE